MATLTWTNTSGGDWNTGSNWSGGNVPAAVDDAMIAGAGTFAVTADTEDAVQSINLNDPNAQLVVSGQLDPSGTVALQAGTLAVDSGGIIAGGTIVTTAGTLLVPGGTLSAVTLEGSETLSPGYSGPAWIANGLTLEGAGGTGPGTLTAGDGNLDFDGAQSISGGTVVLGGSSPSPIVVSTNGVLSIASNASILVTGWGEGLSGAFINDGFIHVASGGSDSSLSLGSGSFENDGTILIDQGSSLILYAPISGSGTIDASSADIILQEQIETAQLQGFGTDLRVHVTNLGTIDNAGTVLSLGADAISRLTLQGGTILGGTIAFQPGGQFLTAGYSGNVLNGVVLQGTETLAAGTNDLIIDNGLSLQGSAGIGPGSLTLIGGEVEFDGDYAISGGTIELAGTNDATEIDGHFGTLTIAPNAVLSATGAACWIDGNAVNDGLITVAAGAELRLGYAGPVANAGILDAAPGSTLDIGGAFTNNGIVNDAGALVLVSSSASSAAVDALLEEGTDLEIATGDYGPATFYNTGTLTIGQGAVGSLTLSGGTVAGGVIEMLAGGSLISGSTVDGLSGVTLASTGIIYLDRTEITDGLTLRGADDNGPGTLEVGPGLDFVGSQTLGGGTVITGNTIYRTSISESGGTLTLARDLNIISDGPADSIAGEVINQGGVTIAAGAHLSVGSGGTFDNAGGITVEAGGALVLAGSFVSTGSIAVDGGVDLGGTVTAAEIQSYEALFQAPITLTGDLDNALSGVLDNTGGTLALGTGAAIRGLVLGDGVFSGAIDNGAVIDTGNGLMVENGELFNVAYAGSLAVNGNLRFDEGSTFLDSAGARSTLGILAGASAEFDNNATLDNVNIQSSGSLTSENPSGTLTLGGNASFTEGFGGLGALGATLVNLGTIAVSQSGELGVHELRNNSLMTIAASAVVSIGSLDNYGLISISNDAVLSLGDATINAGRIAEQGATVNFDAPVNLGVLNGIERSGGIIAIGGMLNLGGDTLNVGASTSLGQLRDNSVVSGGTIHDSGSGLVFIGGDGTGGTLSADTYQGTVNLIPAESTLTLAGAVQFTGANGTGAGTINLLGNASELDIAGSQTIDDVTINIGDNYNATNIRVVSETGVPAVLTLGANANVDQWGARAVFDLGRSYGNALVNDGAIGAVAANGAMLIQEGTFANDGKLIVANGDTLGIQVDDFANLAGATLNGGSWQVNAGSTLDLGYDNQVLALNASLYLGGPGAQVQTFDSATGQETTLDQSLQTIGGAGELVLANGASFDQAGVLRDFGRIVLAGGTLEAAPLAIFPGGDVIGAGTIAGGAIYDSGILMAQGGNLVLDTPLHPGGAPGAAWINVGATLTASSAVAVAVRFVGATGELVLEQANAPVGTISGFTGNDVIDLQHIGTAGLALNFSNGVLAVSTNGTTDAALRFAGSYVTANFSATSDGHGGTLIKDPPVSVGTAALTPGDFGGVGEPAGGSGRVSSHAGGTIAAPSVVGMVAVTGETTHGGVVAMLTVGH